MDKPRSGYSEKRRMRRTILLIAGAIVVALVSVGISQLKPADKTVEYNSIFTGKVQRGEMVREVRGPGQLVPVDVRTVSAPLEGRVESIPSLPGVTVTPDTVLVEMTSPEIEQNAFEAQSQLRGAEADLQNLKATLASSLLNQQAQVAAAESAAAQATLQVEANENLYGDKLISEMKLKLSRLESTKLTTQSAIEEKRYVQAENSNRAQIASQEAKVAQLRALYGLRQHQVESLRVRAGIPGVLQELPVQVGQRVAAGTNLAKVARPELLKAELKIQETQAKDAKMGMRVQVDTRNGVVPGHIIRIAPSSQDGTVTMDVALDAALPPGARPGLTVDGTIEIERLANILYVNRPTFGQPDTKVEVFKVVEGGQAAIRVPVQLGRSSVSTIEVIKGLDKGDEIILSDMQQFDGSIRVRLHH
jgi:HlyD family secretion protein